MKFLIKLFLTALAILLIAWILPGVHVEGLLAALLLAFILAILNVTIKPIFQLLTIPITLITLGLFLLVINALMVMLAEWFVPGVEVAGFWWALLFGVILSIAGSIIEGLVSDKKNA